MAEKKSLIVFPCDFPIKIIGKNDPQFFPEILALLQSHHPEFKKEAMNTQLSGNKNYVSFTATVRAVSQEKLDALYRALSKHSLIKMVL